MREWCVLWHSVLTFSADFAAAFPGFWAGLLPSLRLPVTAGTAGDVGGFSPLQQPW